MPKWVGAMSRRKEGRVGSGQHVKRLVAAVGFGSDAQGGRSGGIPGQMRRNRRGTDSRAGQVGASFSPFLPLRVFPWSPSSLLLIELLIGVGPIFLLRSIYFCFMRNFCCLALRWHQAKLLPTLRNGG
jgi:hypothetical protein